MKDQADLGLALGNYFIIKKHFNTGIPKAKVAPLMVCTDEVLFQCSPVYYSLLSLEQHACSERGTPEKCPIVCPTVRN